MQLSCGVTQQYTTTKLCYTFRKRSKSAKTTWWFCVLLDH